MTLFKPKNIVSKLDIVANLSLILALLASLVYPFRGVEAKEYFLANSSQNNTSEAIITESSEAKMFSPDLVVPDKRINGVISFYSSTPNQTDSDPFTAADGTRVYDGMIANNCLPLYGRSAKKAYVKIPALYGDKIFKVHDRMNKRYGCGKFDIWMDAPVKELFKLGIKRAEVEVYFVDEGTTLTKKS